MWRCKAHGHASSTPCVLPGYTHEWAGTQSAMSVHLPMLQFCLATLSASLRAVREQVLAAYTRRHEQAVQNSFTPFFLLFPFVQHTEETLACVSLSLVPCSCWQSIARCFINTSAEFMYISFARDAVLAVGRQL